MPKQSLRSGVRAVDRTTFAYDRLRELIVHGQLAPGMRLVETELAERLGISRTPIRGAIQRLQQEGFLVARDEGVQARPKVAPLTREDAAELFGLVGALEALAAKEVAALPDQRRAKIVSALESVNRSLEELDRATTADSQGFYDNDHQFHATYVRAGAGPRLLALHDATKPQAERYVRLYVSHLSGAVGESAREHDEIIEAIRDGRGRAVFEAVLKNWQNASERLADVIDVVGERGSW